MSSTAIPAALQPVGCVGLGIMGAPMTRNLLAAGSEVHVWARRPEQARALAAEGATVHENFADLLERVRVLVLNVSDTPDVAALMEGPGGVLDRGRPGLIVIDHSTIEPVRSRELAMAAAGHDMVFIDAPVSGGEPGARAGTLSLMIGGPAEAVDRVRPLLEAVGSTLTHVGDSGAGQVAKACNQLVVGETLAAIGEAFALAEGQGVDPARIREALLGGFAGSRILEVHGQRLLDNDFTPGFQLGLYQKDTAIVAELARRTGLELDGVRRIVDAVNAACADGRGEADVSLLARYSARGVPR
ncbi:NAD(P)-dependent oxidoreductase [Thioalkalivibrio sp. ALJ24]|uniref:NAD(P)-dependent oxidoreductase n=1 Tax=Thioalkalivibrio sp. ALJ24 TaxID=545276 RepID=UPI0003756C17|nr:NAD(P)-dependent oxidoreductase [Thioalkalivibrio sp. ALJ24]